MYTEGLTEGLSYLIRGYFSKSLGELWGARGVVFRGRGKQGQGPVAMACLVSWGGGGHEIKRRRSCGGLGGGRS